MDDRHLLEQALLGAARRGNQLHVLYLIEQKHVDINCRDIDGKTPLHHAAKNHHIVIVHYLLQKGAQYHLTCYINAYTALHEASMIYDPKMMLCLIQYGSDGSAQDFLGWTPIHYSAAYTNNTSITAHAFEKLLKNTISHPINALEPFYSNVQHINLQNKKKETALHIAVKNLSPFRVRQLLRVGAHIDIKDEKHCTALKHAIRLYIDDTTHKRTCIKIINDLLIAGGSLNTLKDFLNFIQKAFKEKAVFHLIQNTRASTLSQLTNFYFEKKHPLALSMLTKPLATTLPHTLTLEDRRRLQRTHKSLRNIEKHHTQQIENFKNRYQLKIDNICPIFEDYLKIRGNPESVVTLKWLLISGLLQIKIQHKYFKKLPCEIVDMIWKWALFPSLETYGISEARASNLIYAMIQGRENTKRQDHLPKALCNKIYSI